MAARQTEACERGQVPALRKADQVAAPAMRGGTGVRFLPVTHQVEPGRAHFCHFASGAMPSQAPAPTSTHVTPSLQSTVLGAQGFCRMAGSCPAVARQGHVQPAL